MKACHQRKGSLQVSRVLAGHFYQDKMVTMVVVMWYFPNILKQVIEIIKCYDA